MELLNPEISILLLDDPQIRELNREYRKKDKSTDVLSFPMLDDMVKNVQPQLLGDIVISVETAEKQAEKRKCSLYNELSRLLIHGTLHLLGYDHELSKKDAQEMRKKKMQYLKNNRGSKNKSCSLVSYFSTSGLKEPSQTRDPVS